MFDECAYNTSIKERKAWKLLREGKNATKTKKTVKNKAQNVIEL